MKKVVCIANVKDHCWKAYFNDIKINFPGPNEGEICTIRYVEDGHYQLIGYNPYFEGIPCYYDSRFFRDVNKTFADQVLEKIKEQIKEEELIPA